MRGGMRRVESRIPDSLRVFRRKLATAEKRSLRFNAVARKIPERENAGTHREKCASPGDRPLNRFAGSLSAAASQIYRRDGREHRRDVSSRVELRRTA